MEKLPDPEFKGIKSARKFARELLDLVISERVLQINSKLPTVAGPTGKLFNIPVGTGTGTTTTTYHPFEIVDASNATDGTRVRVYYGEVNGVTPSGMTLGDSPPLYVSVSGSGHVYVAVTTDSSGIITAVAIGAAAAVPADTSTLFHYSLGTYAVSGGATTVADSVNGSLAFTRCRNWFSNPTTYTADWDGV